MHSNKLILFLSFLSILILFLSGTYSMSIFVGQTFHQKNLIIIDPGHGGSDPGKVGFHHVLEKDINLQIAKKLAKKLKKEKYTVKLTRSGDYTLSLSPKKEKKYDLSHRKQMILSSEPSLVISIHQNSYPRNEVKGAQVFYYTGFETSKKLADCIQTSFQKNVDASNHRVSKSNTDYYLLRDNPYPTVIVECGFLSNEEECANLASASYQKKVVAAIVQGIKDYKK